VLVTVFDLVEWMLDSYYLYLVSVGDAQVQNCRYGGLEGLIKRFATPYWMVRINPLKFQKVDIRWIHASFVLIILKNLYPMMSRGFREKPVQRLM